MQDTFARATHSAGRPSAARDDRVSCIQIAYMTFKLINKDDLSLDGDPDVF